MLKNAGSWIMDNIFGKITDSITSGITTLGSDLAEVCILGFIIGLFFTMAGAKKTGTKVSSISFMVYLLLRVVLSI